MEPKLMHETCWLCGSSQLKNLYKVNTFTIVKCQSCSLHFVKNVPSDEYLKKYYTEQLPTQTAEYGVYSEQSNEKNLQYAHAKVAEKIKKYFKFQDNLNILDLGCSNGSFLEQFPNWNVYGIELDDASGKIAQNKHKNIFIGDMKDADFEENFFDCITINDALDHSNDVDLTIKHCYSLLKPNGILVIKVHNINCWLAKLTGKRFYAIIPPSHLTYFSKKTLKLLLKKHHFEYSGHFFNTQKLRFHTAIMRAATTFPFLKPIQKLAKKIGIGNIPIYKNFHDIITVIGVKDSTKTGLS